MPFSIFSIKGFLGNGAFWMSCNGRGFMFRDVSVNKLTYDESMMDWRRVFGDVYFCTF